MLMMMMRALAAVVVVMLATTFAVSADTPQCGWQAGGKLCPECLCCSSQGFCGNESAWCGAGCQSQCNGCGVKSLISKSEFEEMLLHHDNHICPGKGFYTYDAFIAAAGAFPGFGTRAGADKDTLKREIAAFLAQTSHETMLGWEAPDGNVTWTGYCLKEQAVEPSSDCCQPSKLWPCYPGKQYCGRGPFNISWNYNYGPAGEAIHQDLLRKPEMVADDPVISFKTAIWFWMTPQSPAKPSCHDAMTGEWSPSDDDQEAGRLPGYGVITNIINGEVECGHGGPDDRVESRITFYKRYCDILGVSYGDNLDCYNQRPFATSISISTKTLSARAGEQCGSQAGGKLCSNGLCCSKWGFCGSTPEYCCDGCQSQCKPNECDTSNGKSIPPETATGLYHADA